MASQGRQRDTNTNGAINGATTRGKREGLPRLPPIPSSALRRDDPYAKSKLLTYRAAKEKQDLLTKIMLDNAMQAYDHTVDHNKKKEQKKDDSEPTYPDQVRIFLTLCCRPLNANKLI